MKDARLVDLRLRGDRDRALSDGAARTLAMIVSERYLAPEGADVDFPLPWSKVAWWFGLKDEHDVYRRLKELQTASPPYLKSTGLRGCPARQHFLLCVSSGEKPRTGSGEKPRTGSGEKPLTSSGKKPGTSSGEKPVTSSGEKPGHLLSNPFGKEIEPEGKNSSSLRSTKERGGLSSLRSTATKGGKSSLPLVGTKAAGARKSADELLAELKKATQ